MLNIPYVKAPKNACALACYTMVAKYFFPETTFQQIAKISEWEEDYIVWANKFWLWIMDKGVKVEDYDLIDYYAWVDKGLNGLRESVSEKAFKFYTKRSKNLNKVTEDIQQVINHKNFTYYLQKPKFSNLITAYKAGKVCEVTLDSRTLDNREGFSLHRVVILGINDETVTFHDPREKPKPARQESVEHFTKAWLEAVSEPELCVYSR